MLNFARIITDDRNGRAMARALDAAAEYFNARVQAGLEQLYDVDKMSERRLDDVAWEYSLPWYDYNADIETKRRVIKSMRKTLMTIGTPRAVAEVVSSILGGTARLTEWPEYGGQAYHFRIISSDTVLSLNERAKLYAAINTVKNVRSVMDEMVWAYVSNGDVYVAGKAFAAFKYESRVNRASAESIFTVTGEDAILLGTFTVDENGNAYSVYAVNTDTDENAEVK